MGEKWIEVFIKSENIVGEALSAFLFDIGAHSLSQEDISTFRIGRMPLPENTLILRAYFPETMATEILEQQLINYHQTLEKAFDKPISFEWNFEYIGNDWEKEWKKFFEPMNIGCSFVITQSWNPVESSHKHVLTIDPALAFGTGRSETTRMCMEFLERYYQTGMRVLDLGSGTGILALAAEKLGAQNIIAVENDRVAIDVALDNLAQNKSQEIQLHHKDISDLKEEPFDLILGNLTYMAYKTIGTQILQMLAPTGFLIASGILREDAEKFHQLFPQIAFVEEHLRGEWWSGVLQWKENKHV